MHLADSVPYSVPDDFTYKFEGINVQYSYPTHTPIESCGRDASIAYRFCMHQSASRPSSGRFTAAIFLSHVGRGTHKTREPAWCLAHRAGSRAVLGTCRGRSRSPGPSDRLYATPARRHRRGAPKTSRRSFEASLRLRATQQRAALPRVPPPRAPSLRTVFAAGVGDLTLFLLTWCGPGF